MFLPKQESFSLIPVFRCILGYRSWRIDTWLGKSLQLEKVRPFSKKHYELKALNYINLYYSPQPLDKIKEYFGTKVALYFAWMGFYSYMLIPLSILSIVYCLYGLLTWGLDDLR